MPSAFMTPLIFAFLFSVAVGHIAYLGLALDRIARRDLENATQQAREEERYHLNNQIAQLDRQRALGRMSASLGHELNQPLTAILTNTQVAQRGIKLGRFDQDNLLSIFDKIEHNTLRASKIITRIRDFIRPSTSQIVTLTIQHIVNDVIELVADDAKKRAINIQHTKTEDVQVEGDAIQLSQVLLNALRNAIESVSETPTRNIHITYQLINTRICIRIQDSGPGFTTSALSQAGTAFFTTKESGLGMGLSISRTIMEQHGGTLTFGNWEQNEDKGAYVDICLPLLQQNNP